MELKWYKCSRDLLDNIPNDSGVYIISTKQQIDNKFAVNYVGQSEHLMERIKEHFSESEKNEDLKRHLANNYCTKISYAECSYEYLNGIEKYLYQTFKPNCNNITPPGDETIKCNFPDVRAY